MQLLQTFLPLKLIISLAVLQKIQSGSYFFNIIYVAFMRVVSKKESTFVIGKLLSK